MKQTEKKEAHYHRHVFTFMFLVFSPSWHGVDSSAPSSLFIMMLCPTIGPFIMDPANHELKSWYHEFIFMSLSWLSCLSCMICHSTKKITESLIISTEHPRLAFVAGSNCYSQLSWL